MKHFLINFTILSVSSIVSLLIIEVGFRAAGYNSGASIKIKEYQAKPAQTDQYFRYDPLFGHSGKPNVSDKLIGKQSTTNSKGFRDEEHQYESSEDTLRIVLLGDSDVWGIGVNDDETLAAELRTIIKARKEKNIEVISLGISGYGIDQYLIQYLVEGRRYSPDYVVMVFFAENDIKETNSKQSFSIEKPIFYDNGSRLCLGNVPTARASGWSENSLNILPDVNSHSSFIGKNFFLWLNENSALINFLSRRELSSSVLKIFLALGLSLPEDFQQVEMLKKSINCITQEVPSEYLNRPSLSIPTQLVELLNKEIENDGAKLLVIGKPPYQNYRNNILPSGDYVNFLNSLLAKNIRVLDMYPIAKAANIPTEELFACCNHLSAKGHRLQAEYIMNWINQN